MSLSATSTRTLNTSEDRGQPVPVPDHALHEEILPDDQFKPPLVRPGAIASCPITCHLRRNQHLLAAASFKVVTGRDEGLPSASSSD